MDRCEYYEDVREQARKVLRDTGGWGLKSIHLVLPDRYTEFMEETAARFFVSAMDHSDTHEEAAEAAVELAQVLWDALHPAPAETCEHSGSKIDA